KSLKLRLSHFFVQREQILSRDVSPAGRDLVAPEVDGNESIVEDILRWADDGGQMLPLYIQGNPGTSPESSEYRINKKAEEETVSKQ
ncbi:MAG TPA: hypothetical protein VFQ23_01290, partial [Anaerolineales bacterium]|nr:hypothetical protein [Anaerolineales bacterium]